MEKSQDLRIIVTQEDGVYVAQCLEYDICTQAPDMAMLQDRMNCLIEVELTSGQEIDQAPERFHNMWVKSLSNQSGNHEYRLLSAA